MKPNPHRLATLIANPTPEQARALASACGQMGITLADVAKYGPHNRVFSNTSGSPVPAHLAQVFRSRCIGDDGITAPEVLPNPFRTRHIGDRR